MAIAKKTGKDLPQEQIDKLLTICRKEEQDAEIWQEASFTKSRTKALNYYDRRPNGTEVDGQSKVVTSEFADTIESQMPGLMRIFASGENIAEFTPDQPGDEQWAKEASQYIPHVYMRQNEGFRNIHDAFKDALMYRLGGQVIDDEEFEKKETKSVDALPADAWTVMQGQLQQVADDNETEITFEVEPDEDPAPALASDGDPQGGAPPAIVQPPVPTVSGTITTRHKKKRVKVHSVAPEDMLFTPTARTIPAASFSGYRKEATASDLRVLGLEQDEIDLLTPGRSIDPEETQRDPAAAIDRGRTGKDDSERRFWIVVGWVRADVNGDGISEMQRVVYAHSGGDLTSMIDCTDWEGDSPVVLATPILMPHVLVGRSIFDQTEDLQDISTAVTRGLLDNVYQTNRPRPAINARVDINSVLDWTPGSPILMQGNENPNESLMFVQVPSIIAPALQTLEYLNTVRESRTGVARNNQGLNADTTHDTASGMDQLMTAANQRQELIARTFAETFVKQAMRLTYRAVKRIAAGPIQYWDGKEWAGCDPTKWPDDMDLVVNVALGTGNKQQQLQSLGTVGAAQEKLVAAQGGMAPGQQIYVRPEHIANTARRIVEAAGMNASQLFIATPKEVAAADALPKPPPPPDPTMAAVQAEAAASQAKQQSDAALAQQKFQADSQMKQQQLAADIALRREQAAADMQLAREKAALDMQLAREKAALDMQLKQQELDLETKLKALQMATRPPAPGATQIQEAQPVT